MHELHSSVKFDNLLYHYKDPTKDKDFSMYNDAKSLFDIIKNKGISLSHAEDINKMVIKNVERFHDSRQAVIDFYKD